MILLDQSAIWGARMTWLETTEQAFANLGGEALYADLFPEIERLSGHVLSRNQKCIVYGTVESHSEDSCLAEKYKQHPIVFYSVGGLGSGHWGLISRRNCADARPECNNVTNTDAAHTYADAMQAAE
jgi:hypothetical protein